MYSAIPLESGRDEKHEDAFLGLVRSVLGARSPIEIEAKSEMVVTILEQVDPDRLVVMAVDADAGHQGLGSEVRVGLPTDGNDHLRAHDGLTGEPIRGEQVDGRTWFRLVGRQPAAVAVFETPTGLPNLNAEKR